MRALFALSLLITSLCLASCQHSGTLLKETPLGLGETKRVIISIIGEPRAVNRSGYELVSKFYDRKEKFIDSPNYVRERYHSVVTILGDRRPYDIRVQVYVEVKTPDGYDVVDEDENMARKLANRIKEALNESRDKRNVIDDFKAF